MEEVLQWLVTYMVEVASAASMVAAAIHSRKRWLPKLKATLSSYIYRLPPAKPHQLDYEEIQSRIRTKQLGLRRPYPVRRVSVMMTGVVSTAVWVTVYVSIAILQMLFLDTA